MSFGPNEKRCRQHLVHRKNETEQHVISVFFNSNILLRINPFLKVCPVLFYFSYAPNMKKTHMLCLVLTCLLNTVTGCKFTYSKKKMEVCQQFPSVQVTNAHTCLYPSYHFLSPVCIENRTTHHVKFSIFHKILTSAAKFSVLVLTMDN